MPDSEAKLYWPPTGLFPVKIVGARYYREGILHVAQNSYGNDALVFCTATLIPECDNAHDSNSVSVKIGSVSVGHLSRDFAREFRVSLDAIGECDQPTLCRAVISGGIGTEGTDYDYIIELDLDLSTTPSSVVPEQQEIERLDPKCELVAHGDGRFLAKLWLREGVLGYMHKRQTIRSWTTEGWDTINYYVLNRQGIGLGHKLFSVPKSDHLRFFGEVAPIARFHSIVGRNAVIELVVSEATTKGGGGN